MATIEQARQQIAQRKAELQMARQQIQSQQARVLTRAELQTRGIQALASTRAQAIGISKYKIQALANLQPMEQQIALAEQEVRIAEQQQAIPSEQKKTDKNAKIVQKYIDKGLSPVSLTKEQKKIYREMTEGVFLEKKRLQDIQALAGQVETKELPAITISGPTLPQGQLIIEKIGERTLSEEELAEKKLTGKSFTGKSVMGQIEKGPIGSFRNWLLTKTAWGTRAKEIDKAQEWLTKQFSDEGAITKVGSWFFKKDPTVSVSPLLKDKTQTGILAPEKGVFANMGLTGATIGVGAAAREREKQIQISESLKADKQRTTPGVITKIASVVPTVISKGVGFVRDIIPGKPKRRIFMGVIEVGTEKGVGRMTEIPIAPPGTVIPQRSKEPYVMPPKQPTGPKPDLEIKPLPEDKPSRWQYTPLGITGGSVGVSSALSLGTGTIVTGKTIIKGVVKGISKLGELRGSVGRLITGEPFLLSNAPKAQEKYKGDEVEFPIPIGSLKKGQVFVGPPLKDQPIEQSKTEVIKETLPKTLVTLVDFFGLGAKSVGKQIGLDTNKIGKRIVNVAESAGLLTTIPESAIKTEEVRFVDEPSFSTGTRVRRAIGFGDVGKINLPPEQELKLRSQDILLKYNLGQLDEVTALQQLEDAESKYIAREQRKRYGTTVPESFSFGVIAALAPPLGASLFGAGLVSLASKRREALAFAKKNPKLAAEQLVVSVGSALAGSLAVGGIRGLKAEKLVDPKVTFKGRVREKIVRDILKRYEPDFELTADPLKKITGTRIYEIDIPIQRGDLKLRVVEFEKNGVRNFFGQEILKDKQVGEVIGQTISTKGEGGLTDLITRVIKKENRAGELTDLQISQYVEKAALKASEEQGTFRVSGIETEVKLAKEFKLKGVSEDRAQLILRTALFGEKEAERLKLQPFTEQEFKLAKTLSKSKIAQAEQIVKVSFTDTPVQRGEWFGLRKITDIRAVEVGAGAIIQEVLPKLPTIKSVGKFGGRGGVLDIVLTGKAPPLISLGERFKVEAKSAPGFGLTVTQIAEDVAQKVKTPLERTFAIPITGTLLEVAKTIQKGVKPKIVPSAPEVVGAVSVGGVRGALDFSGITKRYEPPNFIEVPQVLRTPPFTSTTIPVLRTPPFLPTAPPLVLDTIRFALGLIPRETQQVKEIPRTLISQPTPKEFPIPETIVKEIPKQITTQNQKIIQTPISQIGTITTEIPVLITSLITPQIPKPQRPKTPRPVRPIGRVGVPPPPIGLASRAGGDTLDELQGRGVDVVVGMKLGRKRTIAKGLPPYRALRKGMEFVDRNIEASFRLVPTNKPPKVSDIRKIGVNKKFRASKSNQLYIVERKKYRLDHPQEKRQIKTLPKSKRRSILR